MYRSRNRTIWSEEEKKSLERDMEIQESHFNAQDLIDDNIRDGEYHEFTSKSAKQADESLKYIHNQKMILEQCTGKKNEPENSTHKYIAKGIEKGAVYSYLSNSFIQDRSRYRKRQHTTLLG